MGRTPQVGSGLACVAPGWLRYLETCSWVVKPKRGGGNPGSFTARGPCGASGGRGIPRGTIGTVAAGGGGVLIGIAANIAWGDCNPGRASSTAIGLQDEDGCCLLDRGGFSGWLGANRAVSLICSSEYRSSNSREPTHCSG